MFHLLFIELGIITPIPITAIEVGITLQVPHMAGTAGMGIAIQWLGTGEYFMALWR
ncbi:hypothetical protein [Methylobacter sp. S3L5C]|uniref:hypothetical protein n=1 Tax=Methylobacter sp. S3L5C TaxID=2839024 RepID=UPI001FAD831D|nr:hypothetical protein [Methylobacter sp. S3L5C]UOA09356.1 hypothetical protein KKZ03_03330 [Methylobacter sp. S3L5C]